MTKHSKNSLSRTDKGHATFNKILFAAASCIAEIGIEKTSITAIAKKAKTSRGLVAHYFPKKSKLFLEIIKNIAKKAYESIETTPSDLNGEEELKHYAVANLNFFLKNPVFFKCFLLFYYYASISEEFRTMNEEFNKRALLRFQNSLRKMNLSEGTIKTKAEHLHSFLISSIEKFYITEHKLNITNYIELKEKQFTELIQTS